MIKLLNTLNYNSLRKQLLGGNITGIWKNNEAFIGSNSFPIMNYSYQTANFINFEKNIDSTFEEVSYHLSGYGLLRNEAEASFIGESIERYSYSLLPASICANAVLSSYKKLYDAGCKVLPLDLINNYYNSDQKEHYITEMDNIKWIKLPSLFGEEEVFIPLQLFIMYNQYLFSNEKRYITSAVSTGTSCHETTKQSLENSLIEYLQIDSFNLWWYSGTSAIPLDIDVKKYFNHLFNNQPKVQDFLNHFTVNFLDISFDKSIYIIVCEMVSESTSMPKYVVGVQGGYSIKKCIYRAFLECLTVVEYALNISWIDPQKYVSIQKEDPDFSNLDDNVIYYAKYGKPRNLIFEHKKINPRKKAQNLTELIQSTKKLSPYAVALNITPTEFSHLNTEVYRVILPELLSIALPSYPPYFSNRYTQWGGIKNHLPHPLA
ncbi:YcaO-like family protein [Listeria valentina]|uniref:YcaO-like family protein n=1 Tax=Listeria valentina TaxID=2705293 RepID=UPI00143108A3|nr:YcaO-like family protein [Listeria valentina]